MGSVKLRAEQLSKKASLKNKKKSKSLAPNSRGAAPTKYKNKDKKQKNTKKANNELKEVPAAASEQLTFFLNEFQQVNGVQLSSLELQSVKESCIVELSKSLDLDAKSLGTHLKAAFGSLWKEVLTGGHLLPGKVDPGCPAVLVICTSALRSIELIRGLRMLTMECHAAKLFSKHMKVEEQVSLLKKRVNFACGTPSRIKKLIDIEALGLSRLSMIVLDMHADVKGYSLFTLPQVSDEFWDLYKNYFNQRLLQGDLQICLYGPVPNGNEFKDKRKKTL